MISKSEFISENPKKLKKSAQEFKTALPQKRMVGIRKIIGDFQMDLEWLFRICGERLRNIEIFFVFFCIYRRISTWQHPLKIERDLVGSKMTRPSKTSKKYQTISCTKKKGFKNWNRYKKITCRGP